MKIIDLLNKIANDEEVPKKIKFNGFVWTYDIYNKSYYEGENLLFNVLGHYKGIILNDEIEIIEDTLEEEKKIPDKLIPTSLKGIDNLDEKIEIAHIDTISVIGTVNEIIDYLDYLKSKGE